MCRTHERQQLGKGPVGCCTATFKEPRDAENESAGAHGGHILGRARLPTNELNRLGIGYRINHTGAAAWDTNQVETRAILERVSWHQDRKSTRLNSSHLGISYAV